jgi:Tfp pilus assembly protein PilX
MRNRLGSKAKSRRGSSLIEALASCMIASLILIPTGKLLVDASRWSERIESQNELLGLAESILDETQFQLASGFLAGQSGNSFASRGFPTSRYVCTFSDATTASGIPGRFMIIHVLAWTDSNANGAWDPSEPKIEIRTGMARRG